MKSLSICASALVVLAITCQSASAQYSNCGKNAGCGSHTMGDHYKSGYTANVIWPRQFVPSARQTVCDTYAAMVNNGWRRQNLLGDYHFDPETNELTGAGQLKVQWILTQAPMHRRSVYVQRAAKEDETATRVASVQQFSANLSPAVPDVNVNDTHIVAEGHKAGTVDNIFVGFQANQPPPVLPANTASSATNE
ncbi:MAG: hypothetical protein ACR2NU_03215 [Aeoliella sp.]